MLQLATEGTAADEVVPVLLIEDDEADALLVREYLADAGLGVSLSWQQSLAAATPELAAGPVCVLLDLGLPDSVGFEGIRHVLSLAPDAAVLVLTGASDESLICGVVAIEPTSIAGAISAGFIGAGCEGAGIGLETGTV